MQSKVMTILGAIAIVVSSALPANSFIWGYKRYKVKNIRPFFLSGVVALERKGEVKWYLIEDSAIAECDLRNKDHITMQLLADDPVNNTKKVLMDTSNDFTLEALRLLETNPLAEGISKRMIKHIRGCDYDAVK